MGKIRNKRIIIIPIVVEAIVLIILAKTIDVGFTLPYIILKEIIVVKNMIIEKYLEFDSTSIVHIININKYV